MPHDLQTRLAVRIIANCVGRIWLYPLGSVTYWNAFVSNLEMHGCGKIFDPRLNNPIKFPRGRAGWLCGLAPAMRGRDYL
jgi:hypothetical protein